jgi:hypothetical protein
MILARILPEYLLQRPILSPGGGFSFGPPASPSHVRSPDGLRSQSLRDGIHEEPGLAGPPIIDPWHAGFRLAACE